jgi:serine/threonine-protein kinase
LKVDVGQVIAGKYELQRLLGKGAMGEVWLATHNSLGGEFAVKLLEPADDVEAETASGRFQLEAQIAARLSRKTRHIVSVTDHGEENGLAYLVMELLQGESLEQRMTRNGRLEMPEVAAIVMQIARALTLAHEEGIFHRDLKPANVWLGRDEDGRLLVKLLDFGIARSQRPVRTRSPFATTKDMVLGTPSYMSPEQARGLDSLDYRCDLWALAVVAYEALTGKIPFEGETVEDIFLSICTFRVVPVLSRRPDLPPAIEAFFARAFAPKLEDRFSTARELTEAFEHLVAPEEIEAALGGVPASVRRPEARKSDPNLATAPTQTSEPVSPPRAFTSDVEDTPEDPMSVPLGSTVLIRRRRNTMGFAISIVGLVALLGLGALVMGLRGTSKVSGSASRTDTTSSPAVTTASAEPSAPVPTSTTVALEETTEPPRPSASTTASASPSRLHTSVTKSGTPASPGSPATATTASAALPPPHTDVTKSDTPSSPGSPEPSTATTAPPPPAPPPAKSINKGEIF